MNDLNQMTTPALQDWWERYVCPVCMSKERDGTSCGNAWHRTAAVTYECARSPFSPLSIPVSELPSGGGAGGSPVAMYGLTWFRSEGRRRRRKVLGWV